MMMHRPSDAMRMFDIYFHILPLGNRRETYLSSSFAYRDALCFCNFMYFYIYCYVFTYAMGCTPSDHSEYLMAEIFVSGCGALRSAHMG